MDKSTCCVCDAKHDDPTHEWAGVKGHGFVCEDCQLDACANVGQMRDNIKHTQSFYNLLEAWVQGDDL